MTEQKSTPISQQSGALQGLDDTIDFLSQHPPYAQLDQQALTLLLSNACLHYHPEGSALELDSNQTPEYVGVILQGLVRGQALGLDKKAAEFFAGVGDTLLNVAVFEQRPSQSEYHAVRDSFIVHIPAADFLRCCETKPALKRYCERRASELIDLARQRREHSAALELQTDASLDHPLAELAGHPAVRCAPRTPLHQAVAQMHSRGVGSIVIVSEDDAIEGIFTLHDLRAAVASGSISLDTPICDFMTTQPVTLTADTAAYDAINVMSELQVRHLPVLQDGKLWGVVSERDLFRLQRGSLVQISRDLSRAEDLLSLRSTLLNAQQLSQTLLAHGASARQLTGMITRVNDTALKRCIELVCQQQPWPGQVLWLAFGSEGRGEQTLATDQDNGLVLLDKSAIENKDAALHTALAINQALDEIGFPLCRGNTMASNPQLCLSLPQWQQRFEDIIQSPSPQHLLDATVLFDARPIVGDAQAWNSMMQEIRSLASDNSRFLHALAQHALEWKPALNIFGKLRTDKVAGHAQIDLKKHALQPIISAARVMALAAQVEAVNTEDRLNALVEHGCMKATNARAWSEAFSFVQLQRMTLNQQQAEQGVPLSNAVNVDDMNPLDQRILREAMRQVDRLQQRLKLDYPNT